VNFENIKEGDMRIAIISDIHGNLEAFKTVLRDIFSQRVTQIYCLGDVVGYGPFPQECLSLARKRAKVILLGNHEDAAINPDEHRQHMTKFAAKSIDYTLQKLRPSEIEYFKTLPLTFNISDIATLAHSSRLNPKSWDYLETPEEMREEIRNLPTQICFTGHTHKPYVFGNLVGHYRDIRHDTLELDPDEKYFINVGSVGQPRNGDCRACYGILDISSVKSTFSFRRIFYDISRTHRAMKKYHISDFLSERLYHGE